MAENESLNNSKSNKVFIGPVIILIAIVYIGFLLYQAVYGNYFVNKKISNLNKNVEQSQSQKDSLEVLIAYYKTESFQELEARKKLGLKMPGEKVIKVDVPNEKEQPLSTSSDAIENQGNANSNFSKWIDFIFYNEL